MYYILLRKYTVIQAADDESKSWKIWIYLYVYPSKSHSFIQLTNFNLNVTYFQLTFKLIIS